MAPPPRPIDRESAASAPRIIGGDLRGRRLEFAPHARTRPMKDRVRESLFDLLGPAAVRGALAVDLFAGSGALGFEAVSRGAAAAVLVERHFPTAEALRRTARALGVADRVDVRPGDAFAWAKRPTAPVATRWLVFVSPPWALFRERGPDLAALVDALVRAAPAESTFVVESDESFDPRGLPEPERWRSRAIPPAVLHLRSGLVS